MSVISMKQLLEAGVHFGHQTRRWNPKMAPYIYTERNGIYIIDLQKSVGMVDDAYQAIADIAANGGTVLFVGTKKQAQDAIKSEAERCGMFYVNERWLGGMLTNFKTIQSRIARLKEIETMAVSYTHLEKKAIREAESNGQHIYVMTVHIQKDCLLKAARAFLVFKAVEDFGQDVYKRQGYVFLPDSFTVHDYFQNFTERVVYQTDPFNRSTCLLYTSRCV